MKNEVYRREIRIPTGRDSVEIDSIYTVTEEVNGFALFIKTREKIYNSRQGVDDSGFLNWFPSREQAIEHAVDAYRTRAVELKVKGK